MEKLTDATKEELLLWSRLRHEQDGRAQIKEQEADGMSEDEAKVCLRELVRTEQQNKQEPSDLESIQRLCPFPKGYGIPADYERRLRGALVGRFAGCTLGVPVENYSIDRMQCIAKESGTPFPPTEYWHAVENPEGVQYGVDKRTAYTLRGLRGVPVDDDVTYTILNMLLLEKYGENYTQENVATLWKEILPYACTAEDRALKNLLAGCSAAEAAEGNPYIEWIGAAIRADAFGYAAAGDPARAALMSYNDAFLTHRRNGIYGEMFAAGAVAAAFVMSPANAVKAGALCIPEGSRLRKDLDWAFSFEGKLQGYAHARALLDERFAGMHCVHVENNMCAVVFAIFLGAGDFTRTISQSVAMGMDNDCNAATVGSIVGAHVGIDGIARHWYNSFGDSVRTYLRGYAEISIEKCVQIFQEIFKKIQGRVKR